jgi:chromosome segregation ATPase
MGDIVTWLRIMEDGYRERGGSGADDFKRAADEIESLRADRDAYKALAEDMISEADDLRARVKELEKILMERDEEWDRDVGLMRGQLVEKNARIAELEQDKDYLEAELEGPEQ